MTRLIDADAIYKWYLEAFKGQIKPDEIRFSMNDIRDNLQNIPTIDAVSVRRGKWKQTDFVHKCFDIQGFKTWGIECTCDGCGFKTIFIEGHFGQYKYCPNCGAIMDEDAAEPEEEKR